MAPVFQAAGAQASSTGASVSVAWPTHQTNDIGLVVIETSGNSATLTPPTGWAAIPGTPVTDLPNTSGSKLHVWWKRAASSAEASVATGAATDHIVARLYTFRGCITTGNPWNVTATRIQDSLSNTALAATVTTTVDDTLITMVVGRSSDALITTTQFGVPTNSNLTGLGEAGEAGTTLGNGGGFVVSYGIKATTGATGLSSLSVFTLTTITSVTLALRPPPELIANKGNFTLSGNTVGLLQTATIVGTTGTFSLVGNDADFPRSVALDVDPGTFTFTGNNAALLLQQTLIQQAGTFNLSGVDVVLDYITNSATFTLDVVVGAYNLAGTTLNLNKRVSLVNQTGTFSLVGNQLDFIKVVALHSIPGTFSVAGKDAFFSVAKNFILTTRTYSVGYINSDINRLYQINSQVGTYQLNALGLNYFSTRRLETLPINLIVDFRAVGNFFWYQTTQTIQPVKYKITKRNEWILGRATHMGRRGL